MSYQQRMATFEQFTKILETSAKNKFRYAPSADQIDGLMEGVTVILSLEAMSVDYAEHVGDDKNAWQTYVPRHRVRATILFDGFNTYEVDVEDNEWFALPSIDQWQASLPVIHLPAEVIEKILDENAPEYLDNKDDKPEDGGSGVTAPTPDPEPAPTTSAAKRTTRRRQPKSLGAGKGPADLSTKEMGDVAGEAVPSETPVG